jgi:xanthine dehydrogenase YagS FAD-binding subunit
MQAFHLSQPTSLDAALAAANARDAKFIAGGTDLMQLLKDNVESPAQLVDLEHVGLSRIQIDASGLRLQAMARMSDVAAHPEVRAGWPVIAQALEASASPQVRNMGTIGGNLLQRTTSETPVSPATSVSQGPAVPPSPAKIACWRSSASAITASLPMLRILPWR